MIREVVLDTETGGLHVGKYDLLEIGAVELIDKSRTGKYFHTYLKSNRPIDSGAFAVHGLSAEFLRDKPSFAEKVNEFMDFIGTSQLVIHNAPFDLRFLNYELQLLNMEQISKSRVVDTLVIARKKFPGSPANLDALCKRFNIDLGTRKKHGALIDSELLSAVYIAMHDNTQSIIGDMNNIDNYSQCSDVNKNKLIKMKKRATQILTQNEIAAHNKLLSSLKKAIWYSDNNV